MKRVEFTGSPKPYYKTKEDFLTALKKVGEFEQAKMTKKNNKVDILCCDSPDSGTSKLALAAELGVEIMTYQEMVEVFNLETE